MGESDDISWEVPVNSRQGAGFGHGFTQNYCTGPWLPFLSMIGIWQQGQTMMGQYSRGLIVYRQGHCGKIHYYPD